MNRLHHPSDNPPLPPRAPSKPLAELAWIAPLAASAVAATQLFFPSVKAGEHLCAPSAASSPADGLDAVTRPGLLPAFAISHIVLNRFARTEEPGTHGASIAVYER